MVLSFCRVEPRRVRSSSSYWRKLSWRGVLSPRRSGPRPGNVTGGQSPVYTSPQGLSSRNFSSVDTKEDTTFHSVSRESQEGWFPRGTGWVTYGNRYSLQSCGWWSKRGKRYLGPLCSPSVSSTRQKVTQMKLPGLVVVLQQKKVYKKLEKVISHSLIYYRGNLCTVKY